MKCFRVVIGKSVVDNLTAKTVVIEDLSEKIARVYVGGAGLVVKNLFDEVPANIDLIGPENKLIFPPVGGD